MPSRRSLRYFQPILLIALAAGAGGSAWAADPTSPNFSILRGTVLGGGGASASASYAVTATVASTTENADASSPMYVVTRFFAALPDHDGDAITDNLDNCTLAANPDQRDTNHDGYGNRCDGDLNDDGTVNNLDLGLFKQRYGGSDPDADFNGDGPVNNLDLGLFKQMYGKPVGPSGIAP